MYTGCDLVTSDLVPDDDAVQSAQLQGLGRFWAMVFALELALILGPLCGWIAPRLPSIRHPSSPAYFIRYLLMHATPIHVPGEVHMVLVGSSLVRNNLDEGLLAQRLTQPGRTVWVANLGVQGAFALSTMILLDQLRKVEPEVVVWGINAEMFSAGFGGVREDINPWRRPMAVEFGSRVLYSYLPELAGRHRAASDEFALRYWPPYRYRLYFRQYLAALRRAQKEGADRVFGPYASEALAPNPARLEAALARRLKVSAVDDGQTLTMTDQQIETIFAAANSTVSAWDGKLVIAWLPTAFDGQAAPSPAAALVKSICAARGVPFLDLRGTVPRSGFCDTLHASVVGKRQTTEVLASRLQDTLAEAPGGGG
jgi:hypothetical protein